MKKAFPFLESLIIMACIMAVIYTIGFLCKECYQEEFRSKAINLGMAEYTIVDAKKGRTEFTWKKSCVVSNPVPMFTYNFTNNDEVYVVSMGRIEK